MLKTKTFVIKREIIPVSNEFEILEKYNRVANQVYNACINRIMKQYNKLRHDRDFQKLQEDYKLAKDNKEPLDDFKKRYAAFDQKYGLTEYSLHDYVKYIKRHFNLLGIDECQKLATRAFRAYKKYRFGNAKRVYYRKHDSAILIEGKSQKSTCKYINGMLQLGRKRKFLLKEPDDYQKEALTHKVKYSGVFSEVIRGKKRWFALIVLEGNPPLKRRFSGHPLRKVSLDLGPSIAALASKKDVNIYDLSEGLDYIKIRRIQRAMDRSRRANNAINYNKDGACKSFKELKQLHKSNILWTETKHYKKLKAKLQELYRHLRIQRKQRHEALANYIISLGLKVFVEKINLQSWQKKSQKTIINPKTNRPFSKKRFGKSISNASPGMLLSIIERKLSYYGGRLYKYNPYTVKASQYNHLVDDYIKKNLNNRIYTVNGILLQRDMYSAYIGLFIKPDLKTIDKEHMYLGFKHYLELQNEAINNLKNTNLKWYVS